MKKIIFFFLSVALFYSCEPDKNEVVEENQEVSKEEEVVEKLSPENLKDRITLVKDSTDKIWQEMEQSEKLMIEDVKRLLEEVSYTQNYNTLKQQKLMILADSVQKLRYTQNEMTSEQIDRYDAATDSLLARTIRLVIETPEMESHSITDELIKDIQSANSNIIYNRVRYDRWAKEFNVLLNTQKESLQQLGEPYSSYKEKPLFEKPVS
jgi:hypothetical protein